MKKLAIFLMSLISFSLAAYAADSVNISYPEDSDSGYVALYNYDFSADTEADGIESATTDGNHFAKVDTDNGIGVLKNSDQSGKCQLKITFPQIYNRDATRIAYTYYVTSEHKRTKVCFYNSQGTLVHQNNLLLRDDGLVVGNNGSGQVSTSIPKSAALTPVRLELQFDFVNGLVDYRVGSVSENRWSFSSWVTDNPMYAASGSPTLEIASIVFSNEYDYCDMYVDDIRVSATKTKPQAKTVTITGMKKETPVADDVLTGTYIYYDENGISENKEATILSWVVSDTSAFTTESTVGDTNTIALNEDYVGKYIKFRVIPVSTAGITGDASTYESAALGPIALRDVNPPAAANLAITGDLVTRSTILLQYDYTDEDADDQGASRIDWYLITDGGEALVKSSTYPDLSLEIKDEYLGAKIKAYVTPISVYAGEAAGSQVDVTSDVIQQNKAYLDHTALALSPVSGSSISSNLYLPTSGSNGSIITWNSSNDDVLATDGSIRRKSTDVTVQLTATVNYNGITYTKNFEYTVLKVKESSGGGGGGGRNTYSYSAVTKNEENQNTENEITEENKTEHKETEEGSTAAFSDLEGYSWAEEAISELHNNGVINGDENGNFNPSKSITRAEFVKMIINMFEIEGSSDISFNDVSEDDWFCEYVVKAVTAGIIKGESPEYFNPYSPITREDMAVILQRVKGFSEASPTDAFNDDSDISDYARTAVYALREQGIINGKGENQFDPKGFATRAEGAKILWSAGK